MTQLYITEDGIRAANTASPNGPVIQIVSFALGSGAGYTPDPSSIFPGGTVTSQTELRGTVQYPTGAQTAIPSNYHLAADNLTGVFTMVVGLEVGDFSFGEIALYMPGGVLFGIAVLDAAQVKLTTTPSQTGNIINISASFQLNGVTPIIEIVNPTMTLSDIRTVGTIDVLSPPSSSPTNNVISLDKDEYDRSNLMVKRDTDTWQSLQYDWLIHSGTVAVSGDKSLSDPALDAVEFYPAAGRYMIQFTSGAHTGQVRELSLPVAWAANVLRQVGDVVRPTANPNVLLRCTTAGTSAAAEPSWNVATSGATTTDGTAVWTYTSSGNTRVTPSNTLTWAGSTSAAPAASTTYNLYRASSFSGLDTYINEYMLRASVIHYFNDHT